eukprot:CFRG2179T1
MHTQLPVKDMQWDANYGIFYEDAAVEKWVQSKFKYKCLKDGQESPHLRALKEHQRVEHSLFYCELCINHVKVFLDEQVLYTKGDLNKHRKNGDVDRKSDKGHPMCKFCSTRFFGPDELFEHLRKKHYQCDICRRNGDANAFYADYNELEVHFKADHIMCQEPECLEAKFIVFGSELEFKAHFASEHGKGLKQRERKAASLLELDFQYRTSGQSSSYGSVSGYDDRGVGRDRNRSGDQHVSSSVCASNRGNGANKSAGKQAIVHNQNVTTEFVRLDDPQTPGESTRNSIGRGRGRGKSNTNGSFASVQVEVSHLSTQTDGIRKGQVSRSGKRRAPAGFGTTLNPSEIANMSNTKSNAALESTGSEKQSPTLGTKSASLSPTPADAKKSPKQQKHELAPIPSNAIERNSVLIRNIKEALEYDAVKFQKFKNMSKLYREDQITSADYYEQFHKLMGKVANGLFSELIALLPELDKQKELLAIHNDKKAEARQNEEFPVAGLSAHRASKMNRGAWASGTSGNTATFTNTSHPPLSSRRTGSPVQNSRESYHLAPLTTTSKSSPSTSKGVWIGGKPNHPPATTTSDFPPMFSSTPSPPSYSNPVGGHKRDAKAPPPPALKGAFSHTLRKSGVAVHPLSGVGRAKHDLCIVCRKPVPLTGMADHMKNIHNVIQKQKLPSRLW